MNFGQYVKEDEKVVSITHAVRIGTQSRPEFGLMPKDGAFDIDLSTDAYDVILEIREPRAMLRVFADKTEPRWLVVQNANVDYVETLSPEQHFSGALIRNEIMLLRFLAGALTSSAEIAKLPERYQVPVLALQAEIDAGHTQPRGGGGGNSDLEKILSQLVSSSGAAHGTPQPGDGELELDPAENQAEPGAQNSDEPMTVRSRQG